MGSLSTGAGMGDSTTQQNALKNQYSATHCNA